MMAKMIHGPHMPGDLPSELTPLLMRRPLRGHGTPTNPWGWHATCIYMRLLHSNESEDHMHCIESIQCLLLSFCAFLSLCNPICWLIENYSKSWLTVKTEGKVPWLPISLVCDWLKAKSWLAINTEYWDLWLNIYPVSDWLKAKSVLAKKQMTRSLAAYIPGLWLVKS